MPVVFLKPLFLLAWLLIPAAWLLMRRSRLALAGRRHRLRIGLLRSLLFFLLGLALADPAWIKDSDRVDLFFVLDVSDSVQAEGRREAMALMERAVRGMRGEDRAGLIVFGETASLESDLSREYRVKAPRSEVETGGTNVAEALRLAVGRFPLRGQSRVVLLTDGNQTRGDALEMALVARSLGVEIDPVPLPGWFTPHEVYMEKLLSPARAALETPFEVRAVVDSAFDGPCDLLLFKNGALLESRKAALKAGKNEFLFKDRLTEPGLYLYRAVVQAPGDAIFQNNEGLSFTQGAHRPKVLYLTEAAGREPELLRALRRQGLELERKGAGDLPEFTHGLLDFSAIILDNVSGRALSPSVLERLREYVRDIGGGLIMIGGDRSFGAGGYLKTPVEEALPVFMDVPTTVDVPGLVLVLVLDKSASMAGNIVTKNKLEGAKIAAFSAVETLNPMDKVGILAFDSAHEWLVPITRADQRREIARRLSMLKEGGGTDLYPALKQAFQVLKANPAAKKHIIILSDGLTQEADFETLVTDMQRQKVSVSTVAVGSDADVRLLRDIARWGGGRSYFTNNPDNIPRIFAGETRIASQKLIVEQTMAVKPAAAGELLAGIPLGKIPPVHGLVVTYPKPGADVLLRTSEGPLLAVWRYGLGRSVAFTSDLSGRWGKDFLRWAYFEKLAAQMVSWARRQETPQEMTVNVTRSGGQGRVTAEVTAGGTRFVNDLSITAHILFPSQADAAFALGQTAPGLYEGEFPARESGAYYLNLVSRAGKGPAGSETFGFGLPYTEEYLAGRTDTALLQQLAALTGGRVVGPADRAEDLFRATRGQKDLSRRLWPFLALAALAVLLADVAYRRLYRVGRLG
jgi:uncharacterized membrane protein